MKKTIEVTRAPQMVKFPARKLFSAPGEQFTRKQLFVRFSLEFCCYNEKVENDELSRLFDIFLEKSLLCGDIQKTALYYFTGKMTYKQDSEMYAHKRIIMAIKNGVAHFLPAILLLFFAINVFGQNVYEKKDSVSYEQTVTLETEYGTVLATDTENPGIIEISFSPNVKYERAFERMSINMNTNRFCPREMPLPERFGTLIWLMNAQGMEYGSFLKFYMLENDADSRRIYTHARELYLHFHRVFPGCIFREIYCRVKVQDRTIKMD